MTLSAIIGWIVAAIVVLGGGAYIFTSNSHTAIEGDHMMASSSDTMMASSSDHMMGSSTDDMMASSSDNMHGNSGAMMDASTSVGAMMH